MIKKNLVAVIVFLLCGLPSSAMQTIFNVPSADVTDKGHVFVEEEAQFRGWNPDAFYWGTTNTAVGVGHNTEVDCMLFNVASPASENISMSGGFKTVIPVPGLKKKFPEREIKLTVGSDMLFGLEGNGVGNWTYTTLSGRLPKVNTRLTAGISYGTRQVFGQETTSFIAGVEQPITKKMSLLADWYSGSDNAMGFFIVGGSYNLPKNTAIYAGYQLPNSPQVGTSGFVVELAKTF